MYGISVFNADTNLYKFLPFHQALLAPVSTDETIISKYVNRLFQHDEDSGSDLVRIHCTNVLRALFRDANFSRGMSIFIRFYMELVSLVL